MSGGRTQPEDLMDSEGDLAVVDQGESHTIVAALKHGDTAITKADLVTLTLELFDEAANTIINSRDAQNILDANGCTVSAAGVVTLELDAADNPIVGTSLAVGDQESHIARIRWTWLSGVRTRTGKHELRFRVRKLADPT